MPGSSPGNGVAILHTRRGKNAKVHLRDGEICVFPAASSSMPRIHPFLLFFSLSHFQGLCMSSIDGGGVVATKEKGEDNGNIFFQEGEFLIIYLFGKGLEKELLTMTFRLTFSAFYDEIESS